MVIINSETALLFLSIQIRFVSYIIEKINYQQFPNPFYEPLNSYTFQNDHYNNQIDNSHHHHPHLNYSHHKSLYQEHGHVHCHNTEQPHVAFIRNKNDNSEVSYTVQPVVSYVLVSPHHRNINDFNGKYVPSHIPHRTTTSSPSLPSTSSSLIVNNNSNTKHFVRF
jgi:hypothetical protein